MARHPSVKEGETFIGNIRDKDPLGEALEGLAVELRKPAFDIYGTTELPAHSAVVILNGRDASTYNRRMEKQLEEIRSGKRR